MYSFFHPELAAVAMQVHDEQLCYERGGYSAGSVAAMQCDRFNSVVDYAHSNSKFYSRHLDGFVTDHLHGFDLEDVSEIPFTTKSDLRIAQHDIASQPLERAWVYYETTGTTGPPTPCPRNEIDSIVNNTALILRYQKLLAQHGDVHVVGVMGPTELHSTGDTFEDVFRALGHTVVKMWPRSPLVSVERALRLVEDLGITVLVCTPAVAVELARHLIRVDDRPARLQLKCLFALGELVTPQLLANLGTIWDTTVYNCMYASQEASVLAVACADGRQRTIPLNNYYELIDPDTTARLEVPEDGSDVRGELVVTNLYCGQKPLIRYRTGDAVIASATGDGGLVIEPVGRVLDTVVLAGQRFTAYEVEASIFTHLESCLDYQISVMDTDGQDVLDIVVEMPCVRDDSQLDMIARRIGLGLGVRTRVRQGQTNSLAGTGAMVSWKAARFHDQRTTCIDPERESAQRLSASRRQW